MKVLSLLQPWATLVVMGAKKLETRSWNTKYRGPLLIHASAGKQGLKLIDKDDPFGLLATELLKLDMQYYDYPLGAIIGQVDLIHTVKSEYCFEGNEFEWRENEQDFKFTMTKQEMAFGDYSPGRYGWMLANPVEFPAIIPAKGQLGIWEYEMPEKIGFNLLSGGHASFEGMPDRKTVEALEELVKAAKQSKLF